MKVTELPGVLVCAEMCDAHIAMPPPVIGWMEILPDVRCQMTRKPAFAHRLFMRWLLGWKWIPRG